jgi:hypothetical protein
MRFDGNAPDRAGNVQDPFGSPRAQRSRDCAMQQANLSAMSAKNRSVWA